MGYPDANVILRGHVHYSGGAYGLNWEACTLPAFTATGMNSYGDRQCKGVVHFGYSIIYVDGANWSIEHYVTPLNTTIPKIITYKGN